MRRITFTKDAVRTLSRLPTGTARLIRSKIEQYAVEPSTQANNVRMLSGRERVLRLRVGDWRVIFSDNGEVIAVIRIAARGSAYH